MYKEIKCQRCVYSWYLLVLQNEYTVRCICECECILKGQNSPVQLQYYLKPVLKQCDLYCTLKCIFALQVRAVALKCTHLIAVLVDPV